MLSYYRFLSEKLGDLVWRLRHRGRHTEPEISAADVAAKRRFFTRLAQPSFALRPARSHFPPFSDEYNAMLEEAGEDIAFLHEAAAEIARQVESDFNYHTAAVEELKRQLESAGAAAEEILIKRRAMPGLYTVREDFASPAGFTASSLPLAHIARGAVTLQETSRTNLSTRASVTVVPGEIIPGTYFLGSQSNGFPGNTHEYAGGNFVGYADVHTDWAAVADGNPDTWFEYELVSVLPAHRPSKGLYFRVPGAGRIRWDRKPEGGALRLCLELLFEEAVTANAFLLRFYVPQRSKNPVFEGAKISPDGASPPAAVAGSAAWQSAGDLFVHFPARPCRVARFFFSQPYAYSTEVGCVYYEHAGPDPMTLAAGIPGPGGTVVGEPELRVDFLGLEVEGVRVRYPHRNRVSPIGIRDMLAELESDNPAVQRVVAVVPAMRYVIGVRDIEVLQISYAEESEIISPPYAFPVPPTRLVLRAEHEVPDGGRIEYYVSPDGVTWASMAPDEILRVVVDPLLPADAEARDGVLVLRRPSSSFRVRAVLRRPEDDEHATPVVRSFELISVPEGVSWLGAG